MAAAARILARKPPGLNLRGGRNFAKMMAAVKSGTGEKGGRGKVETRRPVSSRICIGQGNKKGLHLCNPLIFPAYMAPPAGLEPATQ